MKRAPEAWAASAALLYGLWILFLATFQPPAWSQAASAPAAASAPLGCTPVTWLSPFGNGSKILDVKTDAAKGKINWCPQSGAVGVQVGVLYWFPMLSQWCLLKSGTSECVDAAAGWSYKAALERVTAASSPDSAIKAVRAEFLAASIPPRTDLEWWEFRRLKFEGCKALVDSSVRPPDMPADITKTGFDKLTSAWCAVMDPGAKPVATTLAAFMVTGKQAYPVTKDATGKWVRSVKAIPEVPTMGADCYPEEIDASQYGVRWYAVHINGVTQPIVAGCSPRKP